ncbi:hypothetical protein PFICI_09158 [Pestalotiopsis fici W106-1]|uniref:Zn(2)-C6 fungal-type domain-containing protein n=1 Tax=Pestalotiopsis fici (strain W106-1 / CGMCC3.15140) TaxID=1229662 RepID=W3WZN4_PESFW|nr:uncharacterized protein PFICI_09158 [Pestalotiopsis fici W106-1]ETS79305.1 hypothetical protein PFICI_09158 [Pestalotiopsis fici W106-1]
MVSQSANVTRVRTRTGCRNCRRKRKKCDEQRPVCRGCLRSGAECDWGLKLVFRPEHAETIAADHPSMQQRRNSLGRRLRDFDIINVTSEVIRDYWNDVLETPGNRGLANGYSQGTLSPNGMRASSSGSDQELPAYTIDSSAISDQVESSLMHHGTPGDQGSETTPRTYEMLHSIAAGLLDLGRPIPASELAGGATQSYSPLDNTLLPLEPQCKPSTAEQSYEDDPEDGLFVPGSAYFEFHSALRNHTFQAARTAVPPRHGAHSSTQTSRGNSSRVTPINLATATLIDPGDTRRTELSAQFHNLSPHEEYELWRNWIEEIAPWLDKFDIHCHFGHVLPTLAREHSHVRFSALALSSRQLERKYPDRSFKSLELYQEAIHQLIPQLQTRTTAVAASCVVLCVLEMMNCSPNMWRQHLDGCASLIQSLGINGSSGGFEQALFWCFARMDLCGAFISNEATIIPKERWLSRSIIDMSISTLPKTLGVGMYANYIVYMCAAVMSLMSSSLEVEHADRWEEMFAQLTMWYRHRPAEMRPVLDIPPSEVDYTRPFPTLLFSTPCAISGTQLYHTACLLMLQKKPQRVNLGPGTRPMLWHARRICAISISNHHHGCWTNCIQPLWIAGQHMSHHAEHRAILEIYELIEKETGWGAKWRANDLEAFWGNLDGDWC